MKKLFTNIILVSSFLLVSCSTNISFVAGSNSESWERIESIVDGEINDATFSGISDICVDDEANIYVIDNVKDIFVPISNNKSLIRKISNNTVTTLLTTDTVSDLRIINKELYFVKSNTIYKIKLNGKSLPELIVGSNTKNTPKDGDFTEAIFSNPKLIDFDTEGNLYILDHRNEGSNNIRKIDFKNKSVSTLNMNFIIDPLNSLMFNRNIFSGLIDKNNNKIYLFYDAGPAGSETNSGIWEVDLSKSIIENYSLTVSGDLSGKLYYFIFDKYGNKYLLLNNKNDIYKITRNNTLTKIGYINSDQVLYRIAVSDKFLYLSTQTKIYKVSIQ